MKQSLITITRVGVGIVFLLLGLSHFYYTHEMAIYVPWPTGSTYFVYLIGAAITFSSIYVLMNKSVKNAFIIIGISLAVSAGFVQLGIESRNNDEILKSVGITNIIKLLVACGVLVVMAFRNK